MNDFIGLMLTPAIMIAVCASLLISTTNRNTRVIERIRQINRIILEDYKNLPENIIFNYKKQIELFKERSALIRKALFLNYSALLFFILTSLTSVFSRLHSPVKFLPIILFMVGLLLLMIFTILLIKESMINFRTTELDIENVEKNITKMNNKKNKDRKDGS